MTLRCRSDDGQLRFATTQRAMRMVPQRQLGTPLKHLGATGQERSHREIEDLLVRDGGMLRDDRRRRHRGRRDTTVRRCPIPVPEHADERGIASQRLNVLILGRVERVEPAENIGRLADPEPQLRQLKRYVFESQERLRTGLVLREGPLVEREGGKRSPSLNAPLHFEQLEVHVDRSGELRLLLLERSQFLDFTRFGAARPRRTGRSIGHRKSIISAGRQALLR